MQDSLHNSAGETFWGLSLRSEGHCSTNTANGEGLDLILAFQEWFLSDFSRSTGSLSDRVDLLRPWAEDIRLIIGPILRAPEAARQLRAILNGALDHIEACSTQVERFADALILLHPVDDILVALSLADSGLLFAEQPET